MKLQYKLFISLFIIGILPMFAFPQTSGKNLLKYWHYRNRLQYFVVPGDGPGESQVATIRNAYIDTLLWSSAQDYGQSCLEAYGPYLGVLSTEYYLLSSNGQDCNTTKKELYFSLMAYRTYWDSLAEETWDGYNPEFDGFFIRGNVPCDFFNPSAPDGITVNGEKYLVLLNNGHAMNDHV